MFTYLGFYLLGIIVCAVCGLTALSYYAVDQVAKAVAPETSSKHGSSKKMPVAKASLLPSIEGGFALSTEANPNLKDLTRIARNYSQELDLFDQMMSEISKHSMPALCSTLCNPTALDRERLKNERSEYLASYYKSTGARALKDPQFRIKLLEIGVLSEIYPPAFRSLLEQINKEQSPSLGLALQLEAALLVQGSDLLIHLKDLKTEAAHLKSLRELVRSCQQGVPAKKILSDCQSQIALSL